MVDITGDTRYVIDYAIRCERGKVRPKNQDNFWCAVAGEETGVFLESENDGLPEPAANTASSENTPIFAVFDGMGGEKHGEIAAYLAAETFNGLYKSAAQSDLRRFLPESCQSMNERICAYIKENRAGYMGTTCALLAFGKEAVYICNLGDSRIYQHSEGKLAQISHDHTAEIISGKKAHLTQHLGVPESEFIIEPYIAYGDYAAGDRYLLCTDGLTDMVPEEEIERILSEYGSVSECAAALTEKALSNGGIDNTTVILCEIRACSGSLSKGE